MDWDWMVSEMHVAPRISQTATDCHRLPQTATLKRGGGTDSPKKYKIFRKLKITGIFRCSFMFKNRENFWFWSKSSFDPPYMGSENVDHFR